MSLTKTQVVTVGLLAAAAPVAFQWHTLANAKSVQQRLNAELTQLRQGVNSQEHTLNALERRLRYRERFIAGLQTAPDRTDFSVPEALKPYLEAWKKPAAPQTGGSQP